MSSHSEFYEKSETIDELIDNMLPHLRKFAADNISLESVQKYASAFRGTHGHLFRRFGPTRTIEMVRSRDWRAFVSFNEGIRIEAIEVPADPIVDRIKKGVRRFVGRFLTIHEKSDFEERKDRERRYAELVRYFKSSTTIAGRAFLEGALKLIRGYNEQFKCSTPLPDHGMPMEKIEGAGWTIECIGEHYFRIVRHITSDSQSE